jgi:hypothetical protein
LPPQIRSSLTAFVILGTDCTGITASPTWSWLSRLLLRGERSSAFLTRDALRVHAWRRSLHLHGYEKLSLLQRSNRKHEIFFGFLWAH